MEYIEEFECWRTENRSPGALGFKEELVYLLFEIKGFLKFCFAETSGGDPGERSEEITNPPAVRGEGRIRSPTAGRQL
jgi:hypothetical protein